MTVISRLHRGNPVLAAAIVSLVVVGGGVALLVGSSTATRDADGGAKELIVYCAAGLRSPVEEIATQYEAEYGVSLRLQYGGSNTLLSQLEVGQLGDLYLAADESYLNIARSKGLVAETFPLARMNAALVVQRGNPKGIRGIDDLLRDDVRVALANPDQAAMGKITRECLQQQDRWTPIAEHVQRTGVYKPTVNDVAGDVALGSVDAGIVWDSIAAQYPELETVETDALKEGVVLISAGVLTSSRQPTSALRVARFLAARDRGSQVFRSKGYQPVGSDEWTELPHLTLFAGAVNRSAIEPIVQAFQERHGVKVNTVYNGCGILTAQMRATSSGSNQTAPDAFMACDVYYMDVVSDLFHKTVNVSDTSIVIAVQPGNPKEIAGVEDLAKPDVRVALGQPEQCTIGVLSRRLLESFDIYDTVLRENVVMQSATSSLLVPSIVTGSADAALVYQSDAQAEDEKIDIVTIDSPLAIAIQPFGIARDSEQEHLAKMLRDAVLQSRTTFEAAGFRWRGSGD